MSTLLARYNFNGSPDTTFDGDGRVTTQFNSKQAFNKDVAVQPDGKIITVGSSQWADFDLASVRYNLDGTLDRTWGGGRITTDFSGGADYAEGIARQADGKLVVVGTSYNGSNNDFGVARYNEDGSLDGSFDRDGILRTEITLNENASDVAIQQDGRIVVAGATNSGSGGNDFALVRYNPDGVPDANFDGDGIVTTAFSIREDTVTGVAIQPADGRIVAVGRCHNGSDYDVCLARYLPDGSLDPSFDTDGRVVRNFSGNDQAFKLAIQSDGKIVTSGFTTIGGIQTWAVYRFNANGSVDTSFDGEGVALTGFDNGTDNYALNLTLQSDGKIVTAGRTRNSASNWDFALARYNTNGSPDNSFSFDGKLTTVFSAADDWALDVAIQTDGKIVAAGQVTFDGFQDFAAARYLTNGDLDNSFGNLGRNYFEFSGYNDAGVALALQPDGKAVIAGVSDSGISTDFALARVLLELPPNCTYSISPSIKTIGIGGGNDFVNVNTAAGCAWSASVASNAAWLTITGGTLGNGNGLLTYSVAANTTGSSRTGTMSIAGQTFTVIQSAQTGCTFTIAPASIGYTSNGGTDAINITTDLGCSWTAISNAGFATITPASASGTGNGTVIYTVQANPSTTPRTGTLTIANQTFKITQGGLVPNLRIITLTSALPRITQPIIIDGAAGNPFFAGVPVIEITGKNLTGSDDGLYITAGGSTIRSLILDGFTRNNLSSAAIRLITNGNNFVEGCYIGSDASGAISLAAPSSTRTSTGIAIQSSDNNMIGGTTLAKRNLISGNDGSGVTIFQTSRNNKVQGNYIGTDITGTVPLGVQDIGVNIQNSNNNTIGGAAATLGSPPGNLISGNGSFGVLVALDSRNNLIQGNRIGTNGPGTSANPNGNAGVLVRNPGATPGSPSLDNSVGGTGATMGNHISGNRTYGVSINPGATGTQLQGNFIGTNAAGNSPLPNLFGLVVTQATGSTIGGDPIAAPNARNVISGNSSNGIFMGLQNDNQVGGTGVTVQNNYIGTNAAGSTSLANVRDGIFVEVQSVTNTIANNRIAFNGGSGVRIPNVTDVQGTPGFRINIDSNEIFSNAALGIDLGDPGVTPNDDLDSDDGANTLQNYPELETAFTSALTAGGKGGESLTAASVTVNYLLRTSPNSTFKVEFFASNGSCLRNQFTSSGERIGNEAVTTDANGLVNRTITLSLPATVSVPASVLATATVTNVPAATIGTSVGNTSEMSQCLSVSAGAQWQPVVLTASQAEIKTWTFQGRSYAYVKVLFPNAGYRVVNFGQAVRSGNDFTADASIERFTGASVQAVTTTAQIYDLGPLANGTYNFNFKTSGTLAKTLQFTVSSATPPPNPIDDAREFVKWQYRDFLNREPDQAGWDFWTDNITKCNDPARRPPGQTVETCTLRQRETTSGAFFVSPEFQYTGYFVYRMYQGALGRQPKLSEFTPDAQFVGAGIVVSGQLSGAKIEENKAAFAQQFVNCTDPAKYRCAEFKAIYDGLSNQAYVDRLFQTTGVNASATDRAALVSELNANPATGRATVLQKVVDGITVIAEGNQQFTTSYGQAFYNSELNRAFVQLEYFGYMKRDPDADGYAHWLGKLNQFGGDFVAAEMVLAFITSPEYRSRFGQP